MLYKFIISLHLIFLFLDNNLVKSQIEYENIAIGFRIDEIQQQIKDSFNIYFVIKRDTIDAKIIGETISISELPIDS